VTWITYGRNANREWLTTSESLTFISAFIGSRWYLRRGWQIKIEKKDNK